MSTAHAELTQALAFLYLTVGQATDGTLTPEEMRTLADKLGKRAPELSLDDLGQVLRQTVVAYKNVGSREEKLEKAQAYAAALRDVVDEKMRKAIVGDLRAIAQADGNVADEELAFIDQTAQTLGIDDEG
jgi:uncharacterized tellurite resistance protein B-like protein